MVRTELDIASVIGFHAELLPNVVSLLITGISGLGVGFPVTEISSF
jgi:hypothetical protein